MAKKNPITTQLILLISLPLIGLIIVSSLLINSAWENKSSGTQMAQVGALSKLASELAHTLQQERGITAGYLESKGKNFSSAIQEKREATDKRKATFLSNATNTQSLTIKETRASLESTLKQLSSIRNQVSSQTISTAEAVRFYTSNINKLLSIPNQIPLLTTEPSISSKALLYTYILNAKENAGIERAVLAGVFAKNSFNAKFYEKFIRVNELQRAYIQAFLDIASAEEKQNLKNFLASPTAQKAHKYTSTALTKGINGEFTFSPEAWFKDQTAKLAGFKAIENTLAKHLNDDIIEHRDTATVLFWAILILSSVLGITSVIFGRKIIQNIALETDTINHALENISNGDLSCQGINFEDAGPTKETLQTLTSKLSGISQDLQNTTHTVANNARDIAANNVSLAQRAEQQATNLEQTSASMEEISTTVAQNADDVKNGSSLSKETLEQAEKGHAEMVNAVEAMTEINQDSKQIAEIVGLIDDIAFQTNLLALNAAVEAARAGDQGRGFAVVATEVRNLAGRSASAATQIKELIEESVSKVEAGSQLVFHSGENLKGIVVSISEIHQIMDKIATASDEQTIGVNQINQALLELDGSNQQNTAMVEEVAEASSELKYQANDLRETASFFKTDNQMTTQPVIKKAIKKAKRTPTVAPIQSNRVKEQATRKKTQPSVVESSDDWRNF